MLEAVVVQVCVHMKERKKKAMYDCAHSDLKINVLKAV